MKAYDGERTAIASAEGSILWNNNLTFTFLLKRKQKNNLVLREGRIHYTASGHSNVIQYKGNSRKNVHIPFLYKNKYEKLASKVKFTQGSRLEHGSQGPGISSGFCLGKVLFVLNRKGYYLLSNHKQELNRSLFNNLI